LKKDSIVWTGVRLWSDCGAGGAEYSFQAKKLGAPRHGAIEWGDKAEHALHVQSSFAVVGCRRRAGARSHDCDNERLKRSNGMAQKLDPAQMQKYWSKTSRLMWTIFALWIFFSFVVHFFGVQLNHIKIAGFPMGFYMAAQGSLIAFVVLCAWNAVAQNKIDEEFGVQED
jgi:putative solute:sodium symporter small subunit